VCQSLTDVRIADRRLVNKLQFEIRGSFLVGGRSHSSDLENGRGRELTLQRLDRTQAQYLRGGALGSMRDLSSGFVPGGKAIFGTVTPEKPVMTASPL
jgi:hypothetical protein